MRVGIDMDGVCADYALGMWQHLIRNGKMPSDAKFPPKTWKFEDWGLTPETYHEEHLRAESFGLWQALPTIHGAAREIAELKRRYGNDLHLHILTARHRPNPKRLLTTAHETTGWLIKKGFHADAITFTEHKEDVLCDLYIDDSPKEIINLLNNDRFVLLMEHEYNKNEPELADKEIPKVTSWYQARVAIENRMGS